VTIDWLTPGLLLLTELFSVYMVIIEGHLMGHKSRDTFICVSMQKVCSLCNGSGQCPDGACYACGSSGRER